MVRGYGEGVASGSLNLFQYFSYIITIALYATGFAAYAATFVDLPSKVWAVGVVLAFTAINFLGARIMGRAESVIVIIKVAILILFVAAAFIALPGGGFARLSPSTWPGPLAIFTGAGVLFVGYEGFGLITNAAANMEKPRRELPRALYASVAIVSVIYVANAGIGFWEEHQAGKAIAALKAQLAIKARVKRDGKWSTPASRELVPGDVIRMRLGDIVPADARLLDGDPVEVDQSALTGESLPAEKKSGDAVFSGSIIRQGEIGALVYATGASTYFGKTAQLVQEAHTVSHFQRAVLKIGSYLIVLAVALVTVIIAVSLLRGDAFLTTLQFALVLTVAAIPVAMPTVLSVTMAVGARLLATKKAIVTRLVAIEELAGVDVLCSDKTGTLTENTLTLGDPFSVKDITAEQVVIAAALASRADDDDTIDLAVLAGLKGNDALAGYQVIEYRPFDPVHKRTEAAVTSADGTSFKVTKGAPQVILELAANAGQVKADVDKAVNEFAARGFRSLGVARAGADGPWELLGVLPLFDPPRKDAKATIATARQLGVKIKMVTGDALAIAQETAKKLGMGANILDASGLGDVKH